MTIIDVTAQMQWILWAVVALMLISAVGVVSVAEDARSRRRDNVVPLYRPKLRRLPEAPARAQFASGAKRAAMD